MPRKERKVVYGREHEHTHAVKSHKVKNELEEKRPCVCSNKFRKHEAAAAIPIYVFFVRPSAFSRKDGCVPHSSILKARASWTAVFFFVISVYCENQSKKQIQRRLRFAHILQYSLQNTESVKQKRKKKMLDGEIPVFQRKMRKMQSYH